MDTTARDTTIQVTLPSDLRRWAETQVEAGYFQSIDEVVCFSLVRLTQEDNDAEKLEHLKQELAKGFADIEAGRLIDVTTDEQLDAVFEPLLSRLKPPA